MIVTLTANPSLDRTVELDGPLRRGDVQRTAGGHQHPGGKGVNVSRALLLSGAPTIAVLPGAEGDPMLLALRAERLPADGLPIAGVVRSNLTITEPDGTTTKINDPGPTLSEAEGESLIELVVTHARDAAWLVLAGSLPPGLPTDFYVRVVRAVRASGGSPRVAVDSSGEAMLALIESGVGVDLVKPNGEELAELTGHADAAALEADDALVVAASERLVGAGCHAVLATLGGRGAVLVTAGGAWKATMPPIVLRSTVGAGDSSLAGYLLAEQSGATPPQRLAQAVAHGAAAASLPGSELPSLEQADAAAADITPLPTSSPSKSESPNQE